MRPREAQVILDQVRFWEAEGIITEEQAEALRERYRVAAETPETTTGTHAGVVILQALGGLLLGAAVIAFTVFIDPGETVVAWILTTIGVPLLAAGLFVASRGNELGDIGTVAALVPLTFTAAMADDNALFFAVPILAPLMAAGMRIHAPYVPALCAIAFATGSGIAIGVIGWDLATWLGLLVLATVGSVLPVTLRAKGAWHAATAFLVVAVAIAALITYFDTGIDWGRGGAQLFIALFMGVALTAGVLLRHRGLILGAAIALAVDAVAFAFDVGGLVGGTLTLLIVAGALIAFAMTWAKKIMR